MFSLNSRFITGVCRVVLWWSRCKNSDFFPRYQRDALLT